MERIVTDAELGRWFPDVDAEALRAVGRLDEIDAGELLVVEGTTAPGLIVVLSGELDVMADGITFDRCRPGTFVGEGAIFGGRPARSTVVARTGGTVLTVEPAALDRLAATSPAVVRDVLEWVNRTVAARIRHLPPPADAPDVDTDAGTEERTELDVVFGPGPWDDVFHVRHHAPGDIVMVEGDDAVDELIVVLSGTLAIDRRTAAGSRYVATRSAGEIVGELRFADDGPRLGSVVAQTDAQVASLTRSTYRSLRDERPDLAIALQRAVGAQLVENARSIMLAGDLGAGHGEDRLLLDGLRTEHCDVLVIGGGPLGLVFAGWVRRWRPDTAVVVAERRATPGHKVGESTLAATIRAFVAMGLEQPVLRRLFANKAGLRFFHCDADVDRPGRQVDVVDIEETYQVERRPLEILMQENARRQGIDVRTSTQVRLDDSDIEGKRFVLEDARGDRYVVNPRVVVDASGPAAVLARHLGVYRKDPASCGPLTYNSYFGYFRPTRDVPLEHWGYPATRHLCFPGGWMWFISVTSWEGTSDDALASIANDLLDARDRGGGADDGAYPTRDQLIARHGGTHHQRVSIGITVRDDADLHDIPANERFDALVDRYPALRWVMDHFELIEEPYEGKRRPYQAFSKMVHDVERFAGDGWLVIGDAAAFTSPLWSPGLNYGVGHAYMAARAVVDALDSDDVSEEAFAEYELHMRAIFDAFIRETEMYYRAFDHVDSYERAIASKIVFGAHDVVDEREFGPGDTRVHAILDHEWQSYVQRHTALQRRLEAEMLPAAERAAAARPLVDRFIQRIVERPSHEAVGLGRFVDFWEPDGTYTASRTRDEGLFEAVTCPSCSLTTDASLPQCPYCGEELAVTAT